MRLASLLVLLAAGCETTPSPSPPAPAPGFVPEVAPLPPVPRGFDPVPVPTDDPLTPGKVALGRQLFFDTRLSGDGSRSCYACHVCDKGLTDGLPTAVGAFEKQLTRASPTLWNIAYHKEFYWDGRSASLEVQALAAWKGANMGASPDEVTKKLNAIAGYREQFQQIFGADATPELVTRALAAFERTIYCGDTPWDRWQAGDPSAVSDAAKAGWEVFRKVGCAQCHAGALFTDLRYHNVGVGTDAKEPDVGRQKVSQQVVDTAAFKTPTLRDVAKSAPYFHDGSKATLAEVVDFMLAGGRANKQRSSLLQPQKASAAERAQLLAFLESLSCACTLAQPPLPP